MRKLIVAIVLTVWGGLAKAQIPDAPQTPSAPSQIEQTPAAQEGTLTVPAGTRIQLKLINPIQTRRARRGDPVRATTAFPVTLGTTMAIPVETFVEGEIKKVRKHGDPALQIRFTRMVFNNGYAVLLGGATAEARAGHPGESFPSTTAKAPGTQSTLAPAMANQPGPQPPQPGPLPRLGPNPAVLIGVGLAITAGSLITGVLWARHRGQDIFFDTGSSFEMVLDQPLTLDAQSIAAATARP